MDNQPASPPQQEPLQTQPQQVSSNIAWLKTLSIGFSLVSFGIAIGIGGYILATQKNQPAPQNQQVTISPTNTQPTPIPDPTTSWKTYKNPKFAFELKYPSTLIPKEEVLDNETYISFIDSKIKTKTPIIIYVSKSDLQSAITYTKWTIEGHVMAKLLEEKTISFAGLNGVKLRYESDNQEATGRDFIDEYIIFSNNGFAYTLQSTGNLTLFNQILSTFQFTN